MAFCGSIVALMASLTTLSDNIAKPYRLSSGLLVGIAACLYIICRTVPSSIEVESKVPLYPRVLRRIAKWLIVGMGFALFLYCPWQFLAYYHPNPSIRQLSATTLIAGRKLTIVGENLPDSREDLTISFNGILAEKVYVLTRDRIELEVPPNATSGPLVLSVKSPMPWLLTTRIAKPVWVDISSQASNVIVLAEDPIMSRDQVTVRFSVRNTREDVHVTIHDILIKAIVLDEPYTAHFGGHRLDLGVVPLYEKAAQQQVSVDYQARSLFGPNFIVKLKPKESESLRFAVPVPKIAHRMHAVFSLAALYHDDQGNRRVSYSDRIYRVIVDDREGFLSAETLDWNSESYDELQRTYLGRIPGRGVPAIPSDR